MNKFFIMGLCFLFSLSFAFATSWPGGSGIEIQQQLPTGYEPSGVIWHPYYNALFLVSDEGILSKMNLDGSNVTNWTISGDLEGITITDNDSKYVYIVIEYPYQLILFDPSTGTKVKTISLTGIVPATNATNQGIEGIAYVPNGDHPYTNSPNDGLFYFGVQENGPIHVVDIDIQNSSAKLVDSFIPVSGRGDISDLFYNTETEMLYVLYDGANVLREIKAIDNSYVNEYSVPGTEQEGIALLPSYPNTIATIFIAEDTPAKLVKYNNYPVTYPIIVPIDSDNDGIIDELDKCAGFDDKLDLDSDSIPDGCDAIDNRDSDNDGVINQYDKCIGYNDNADIDSDGIADGCDTSDDRDQDADGLTNTLETTYGTNPLLADSDNDGLTDYQEIKTYFTNPLVVDTDNGTVSDGKEILNGTNPLNASDDAPTVIDPNAISSYTINSNATILVKYENNTSLTIDPFSGTTKVSVGTNTKKDRLIVTNGKYVNVYKRDSLIAQKKINNLESAKATMTITNMTTYDKIVVQIPFLWTKITSTSTLTNDVLK